MKPLYQLLNLRAFLVGAMALLSLASCGSYQYAGYDSDGIYASDSTVADNYTEEDQTESADNALFYQQTFAQQSKMYGEMAEEGIFTDIDSYASGTYDGEVQQEGYYGEAYGPWGDHADEISINVFSTPYYRFGYPYYGYGYGYGYGYPYYGGYYGGYYNSYWGWPYDGYGYGYHSPWRWNIGWNWGWGHGYYNHWAYNPYYYGGYGYGYYNNRNVVYSNSRRNAYSDFYNRKSESARRYSDSYDNSRNVRANSRSNREYSSTRSTRSSEARTYRTRSTRVESPINVRSNSSGTSRTYRSSEPTYRSATQSSSNRTYRSSTPTRSSGTYRSSGSTTRSSGTSSGGGSSRSSRGRGN